MSLGYWNSFRALSKTNSSLVAMISASEPLWIALAAQYALLTPKEYVPFRRLLGALSATAGGFVAAIDIGVSPDRHGLPQAMAAAFWGTISFVISILAMNSLTFIHVNSARESSVPTVSAVCYAHTVLSVVMILSALVIAAAVIFYLGFDNLRSPSTPQSCTASLVAGSWGFYIGGLARLDAHTNAPLYQTKVVFVLLLSVMWSSFSTIWRVRKIENLAWQIIGACIILAGSWYLYWLDHTNRHQRDHVKILEFSGE